MAHTDQLLSNNKQYAAGKPGHKPGYPGKQPINPAKHVAVVACMDARLDVEDLLGLQTAEAPIIRNAGGGDGPISLWPAQRPGPARVPVWVPVRVWAGAASVRA